MKGVFNTKGKHRRFEAGGPAGEKDPKAASNASWLLTRQEK
jgi:hypothetical protein